MLSLLLLCTKRLLILTQEGSYSSLSLVVINTFFSLFDPEERLCFEVVAAAAAYVMLLVLEAMKRVSSRGSALDYTWAWSCLSWADFACSPWYRPRAALTRLKRTG